MGTYSSRLGLHAPPPPSNPFDSTSKPSLWVLTDFGASFERATLGSYKDIALNPKPYQMEKNMKGSILRPSFRLGPLRIGQGGSGFGVRVVLTLLGVFLSVIRM